ncbi:Rossmann-fold NAD(P)-binding domain-containing protein [Sphingobacterium rhinopitheci]|uniref:lactate dehydrogenase n=1 Tax=Sphingobacterium rhinopitheci TaxID=2781960 RepID=UPI001F519FA8|nr:lactate dehydrogenase [Sphingobacterium rhinopitheci]MCI0919994.1 lactate dehydrogenase [Sphingobacterium rhinopitheci]
MKVVAYNILDFEKKSLAKANAKVHDFTLISNPLDASTIQYAEGKEVIIVSDRDILTKDILDLLAAVGVKKIISRSRTLNHIDIEYAGKLQLHLANTPLEDDSLESIAHQTIANLNNWEKGDCLGQSCHCAFQCAKKEDLK